MKEDRGDRGIVGKLTDRRNLQIDASHDQSCPDRTSTSQPESEAISLARYTYLWRHLSGLYCILSATTPPDGERCELGTYSRISWRSGLDSYFPKEYSIHRSKSCARGA